MQYVHAYYHVLLHDITYETIPYGLQYSRISIYGILVCWPISCNRIGNDLDLSNIFPLT